MSSFGRFLNKTSDAGIQRLDFNEVFNESLKTLNSADASPESRAEAQQHLDHAGNLLKKIHGGLYCTTFPIPSEQEAVEDWLDRLKSGDAPANLQLFTVYGKDLDSLEKSDVAGFIVSEYYKGTEVGLINYVIRDKKYSHGPERFPAQEMCEDHVSLMKDKCLSTDGTDLKGVLWEANKTHPLLLGAVAESEKLSPFEKQMYEVLIENAMERGRPVQDIAVGGKKLLDTFKEVHGEEYWQANDCMDPSKRINHIETKFGAKRIGLDYAQAPLSPPENQQDAIDGTCADLHLYAYQADKFPNLKAEHLAKYMNAFSTIFAGKDPRALGVDSLDRMMAQLDRMTADNIPVLAAQQDDQQRAALANAGTAPGAASKAIYTNGSGGPRVSMA